MDNTYFILSDKAVAIERLHICTWDLKYNNAGIEIGIEFLTNPSKDVAFKLSLPFMDKADDAKCLMESLIRDDDNSKFIFNDTIKANKPVNGDKRNGSLLEFENRKPLLVLPIKDIDKDNGILSFSVKGASLQYPNYIRIYIQTSQSSLSVLKSGIAKTSHIYDIKINERRSLPTRVNDLINGGFKICNTIKQCFCFHVIPSSYGIAYVNSAKLKNIRILEANAFNRYLPIKYKMDNNDYIIVFNKVENVKEGTYTFFSVFDEEIIGNQQIVLAIGANIICSLLFGLSSIKKFVPGDNWYEKLPGTFWIAIIILIVVLGWLFIPWKTCFVKCLKRYRK